MSSKTKQAAVAPLELAIVVEGKIIESNFELFRERVEAVIDEISFDLKTDEDFQTAAEDVKALKKLEDSLKLAKAEVLRQMDQINPLLEGVDGLDEKTRRVRLELNKIVERRRTEIKEGIIRDGLAALRLKSREFSDLISAAIKGKSSLEKMQEAVTEVVERINRGIDDNCELLARAREEHGEGIAYSESAFVCLAPEAAKVEMERRIERHKAALKEAQQKAEIEKLRKESEATKIEASPSEAPAPPAVSNETPAFVTEEKLSAAEELAMFCDVLTGCFTAAKAARAKLQHENNKAAAAAFAETLSDAYSKLQQGGVNE